MAGVEGRSRRDRARPPLGNAKDGARQRAVMTRAREAAAEKEPEEGVAHRHGQSLGRAVGDDGMAEVEANPISEGDAVAARTFQEASVAGRYSGRWREKSRR